MKMRKYTYANKEAWEAQKALITSTDEEGNISQAENVACIVELGHIVVTPATLDEEGEVLTEAVLSDEYCVDILWSGEPHEDFVPTWVTPSGVHGFGVKVGIEYARAYCEANPDAEYCNPVIEEELI